MGDANAPHYTEPTTTYWQEILPQGTDGGKPDEATGPWRFFYPARLPDGSTLRLPIRQLPRSSFSEPLHAVASLIMNQGSLSVTDTLGQMIAAKVAPYTPDITVVLPTLGLAFGPVVAKALGHIRYVPMGYSIKFWYREELSVPVSSVTSPTEGAKRLYLDPNLVPLLVGDVEDVSAEGGKRKRRVALIDDAVSSGKTVVAAKRMLEEKLGVNVAVIGVAMLQGEKWRDIVDTDVAQVVGVFKSPLLTAVEDGWVLRD